MNNLLRKYGECHTPVFSEASKRGSEEGTSDRLYVQDYRASELHIAHL